MVAGLVRVALGLSLLSRGLAQDRFVSEIPAEEQNALDAIVEDEYVPPPANRGGSGWESPVYSPLYSQPLPIPPVKQPKKLATLFRLGFDKHCFNPLSISSLGLIRELIIFTNAL